MPSWKKIITSGSVAILSNVTASSYTGSFTGSLNGTSSWAVSSSRAISSSFSLTAISASFAISSSRSVSSSFANTAISASFATTASFALNAGGGVTINNNINDYLVTATGTANTLNGEANLRFSGTILSTTSSITLRGTDTLGTTKAFHIQTGDGTSIMDLRNETYAFIGCGQGAGNASGFISRWRSLGYTQLTGYNYGNGSSPSYQPIYFDTDQIGRDQGIYINYTTGSAPASTEFAVKGRGTTSATSTAKFQNSSLTDVFSIQDDGELRINTTNYANNGVLTNNAGTIAEVVGFTGVVTIIGNPPPNNLDFQNGILVNVF